MTSRPVILLDTDDRRQAKRWAAALEPLAADIRRVGDSASTADADVIVTDRFAEPDQAEQAVGVATSSRPALLRIAPGDADATPSYSDLRTSGSLVATLPADVPPEQFAMTCWLLAEVVSLRRQLLAGNLQRDELARQAVTDPLTGLANRHAWEDELARRYAESASRGTPLCLAIFDLDRFKSVNDRWGHAAGDELLRATAEALRASLRQNDFLARLGGDEFGLLLSGVDAGLAGRVVERVRQRLFDRLARHAPHPVTASAGYCTLAVNRDDADPPPPCPTAAELFDAADRALLNAKRTGRNRTESGGLQKVTAPPASEP